VGNTGQKVTFPVSMAIPSLNEMAIILTKGSIIDKVSKDRNIVLTKINVFLDFDIFMLFSSSLKQALIC